MAKPEVKTNDATNACDLRDWLDGVQKLGQLEHISGAHWDLEIGALTEIPYGTVVSRLHRGRQRLRHLLGATVPTIA